MMDKKATKIDFKEVNSYVESIQINGLTKTNDEYVKKHIGSEIFKTKNFEEILSEASELKKNLEKLGCFKSVDIIVDASKNQKSHNFYQVIIDVEETSAIGGGIHSSIGNNEGSLSSSINLPNLFGKGEKLSAEYTYGTRNHTDYRLNYSSPIDLNPDKHFSLSIFRSANDFPWSKYKQNDAGITVDIMNPFKILLRNKYELTGNHIITYEGTWRHLVSYMDSTFDVREQSGHSLKSSFKYTNLIDRRDHAALPTNGGFLKTCVECAGFGGDVKFFRFNSDYQYSKTFFNYFTTQFSFAKGFILPFKKEDKILINDRFFIGGPLSLRGFTNRGAGPHKDDCSLGNDAFWLLGAHLYTPLPFLHKNKQISSWLKTHSFVNMGNILSINQLKSLEDNKLEYLVRNTRLSVGTGLVIAFGNLARVELNYVWPLWKYSEDKALNGLQFGIGINFN